ncbi:MAG TPA: DUF411 domain-containing protein [Pseudomonas xinjiangensis]|uniref:DUF411 domain-containing protein n=2 Tax=root TaxID=1 RepID=A0A7V1FQY8_9GAMM|nr:DUF411 domain-containing protein [Halopseudomonas xinjiangensis]HEC47722.1 DUF411 domain-containing protein [Halopseudomonas xinjiangensis]
MKKLILSLMLASGLTQAADSTVIDVYRDPNCGCCSAWIEHLAENGFTVRDHQKDDMQAVKRELGVPAELASCHTGVVDGRFIEGHVPAADILKMQKRPDLLGLAVPGMPVGSPGMEVGDRQDAYHVIAVDQQQNTNVFTAYP